MRVNERKEQKMLAKKWKENNVIDFRRFLWVVNSKFEMVIALPYKGTK